jgi:hypothetical protein
MSVDWNSFRDQFTVADVAAWGVGLGSMVLFVSPLVVSSLGVMLVYFRAVHDPSPVEPNGADPEYAEWYGKLAGLGFRPAGVIREICWLRGHELRKCHPVRFMVSADGLTYAALYRLGFGPGGLLRVTFDSVTDTGTLIQTSAPGAGITADEPDYHRIETPLTDISECQKAHEDHAADVVSKRGGKLTTVGLDELAEIDERTSIRTLRRVSDTGLAMTLFTLGWATPFLFVFAVLNFGFEVDWPRAVSVALMVAAGCYILVAFKLTPMFFRLVEKMEQGCDTRETNSDD